MDNNGGSQVMMSSQRVIGNVTTRTDMLQCETLMAACRTLIKEQQNVSVFAFFNAL
jgi:hypothetical protein